MRPFLTGLTLLLSSYNAFSQPTKVTLTLGQARRLADSLAVLPLVRREAAAWRQASQTSQRAADSLARAADLYRQALRTQQQVTANQNQLLASELAQTARWKQRARRRGLLNWLGLALASGAGYLFFRH